MIKFLFLITGAEGIMSDEDEGRGVVHYEFGKQRVLFSLKLSFSIYVFSNTSSFLRIKKSVRKIS